MTYKITETLPTEGSFVCVWKTRYGLFSDSFKYDDDGVILTYVEFSEDSFVDDFIEEYCYPWSDCFDDSISDIKFIVEE